MRCQICGKRIWFNRWHKVCDEILRLHNERIKFDYMIDFCIRMVEYFRNYKTLQGFTEFYDEEHEKLLKEMV